MRLAGGENAVYLSQDGLELTGDGCTLALKQERAELTGELYVNGKSLREIITDVVNELLG